MSLSKLNHILPSRGVSLRFLPNSNDHPAAIVIRRDSLQACNTAGIKAVLCMGKKALYSSKGLSPTACGI